MYKQEKDAESYRSEELKQSQIEIDLDQNEEPEYDNTNKANFNFNDFNSKIPSYQQNQEQRQSDIVAQSSNKNLMEDVSNPQNKIANYEQFSSAINGQDGPSPNNQFDQQLDNQKHFTGLESNGQKITFGSIQLQQSKTNASPLSTSIIGLTNNTNLGVKNPEVYLSQQKQENRPPPTQLETKNQKCWNCLKTLLAIIGSILSMLTLVLTILQPLRGKFASATLYVTYVGFVLAKIITCGVILIQYLVKHVVRYKGKNLSKRTNYDSDADEDQVEQRNQEQEKSQGCKLYFAIPFMFYTGSYRFLDTYPFKFELGIAYFIELCLSLIPPLAILTTNSDRIRQNSDLDLHISTVAYAQIVCIVETIIEIAVYAVIIIKERKRKEIQSVTNEEKKSSAEKEKERREKYSRRYLIIAIAFLVLFLALLAALVAIIPLPTCGDNQVLQYGICRKCEDENCQECSKPDFCSKCEIGYYIEDGICRDCDQDLDVVVCEECTDSSFCTKCASRYRLDLGECIFCDMMRGCDSCNEATCLSCVSEFYMNEEGNCKECQDTMNYCVECTTGTICTQCDPYIALLNELATCTCNQDLNWFAYPEQPDTCFCNGFVDSSNNACLQCDQAIPHCLNCLNSQVFKESSVYLGTSPLAPGQQEYLECTGCQSGYFFDPTSKECVLCSSRLGEDCQRCNFDGTQCTLCASTSTYGFANGSQYCQKCDTNISQCTRCSALDDCEECSQCNALFEIFGKGQCFPVLFC